MKSEDERRTKITVSHGNIYETVLCEPLQALPNIILTPLWLVSFTV